MGNIAGQTRQETGHNIQIWKVVHQLTRLGEVVVVPSDLNDARDIVVRILVVGRRTYALQ